MAEPGATEVQRGGQGWLLPSVLLALLLLAGFGWTSLIDLLGIAHGSPVDQWGPPVIAALALLIAAHLLIRTLHLLLWPRLAHRRQRRPVPKLLVDLVTALVWLAALLIVLGLVFHLPVSGLVATSGVAIAVLGFALRDMLGSLFAGMALSLEQPYRIGDWIELEPGTVARIEQVGWLTTRGVTPSGVGIVIPNGKLTTTPFRNYSQPDPSWRDSVEVPLDYAVPAETAERLLLAAMREVPAVARQPRAPDVKIKHFDPRGPIWLARFWVADYGAMIETRYQVQKAVLRHLHYAGIQIPPERMENWVRRLEQRPFDPRRHLEHLLAEHELFGALAVEDRQALAAGAVRRPCRRNVAIVREGEPGSSVFVVGEGLLTVDAHADGVALLHVNELMPGDIFGEFSLLTGAARSATVVPVTDALVYEIDKPLLEPILRRSPELAQRLSHILAERQARTRMLAEAKGVALPEEPRSSQGQLLKRLCGFFGLPDLA